MGYLDEDEDYLFGKKRVHDDDEDSVEEVPRKRSRKVSAKKSAKKSGKKSAKKSAKKSGKKSKRGASPWIKALKKAGYLKKGSFKPLPKKGSAEYKKVVKFMKH